MKRLKIVHIIILVNVAISVGLPCFTIIHNTAGKGVDAEAIAYLLGLSFLAFSLANLFIGFIIHLGGDAVEWKKGFLLSGGILVLLSVLSFGCGMIFP